jgi:hypothetical protein
MVREMILTSLLTPSSHHKDSHLPAVDSTGLPLLPLVMADPLNSFTSLPPLLVVWFASHPVYSIAVNIHFVSTCLGTNKKKGYPFSLAVEAENFFDSGI